MSVTVTVSLCGSVASDCLTLSVQSESVPQTVTEVSLSDRVGCVWIEHNNLGLIKLKTKS